MANHNDLNIGFNFNNRGLSSNSSGGLNRSNRLNRSDFEEKINVYTVPYHWGIEGFYKRLYEKPLRSVLREFGVKDVVLDVGCGDGRLTFLIAGRVRKVYGVDNQEYPIQLARLILKRLNVRNAELKVGSVAELKYGDERFDKVICFDVIEHLKFEDVKMSILEICRVLKKGGVLYLTTPNRRELRGRIFGHKIEKKHYYEYDIRQLCNLFRQHFRKINFYGIYLQQPIPRLEHFANVVPFRYFFNILIDAGWRFPDLSRGILMKAVK